MDDAARRRRVRVSAALIAAGTALFWTSMFLPAVTRRGDDTRPRHVDLAGSVDGWTAALLHKPTFGTNAFLALAFLAWVSAHWFRSAWGRTIGLVASSGAAAVHLGVGVWPGYSRIEALHAGWWLWVAAPALLALSFGTLPAPDRPPPGERLPLDVRDRGRTALAWILGVAGAVLLVASHVVAPTLLRRPGVREGACLIPVDDPSAGSADLVLAELAAAAVALVAPAVFTTRDGRWRIVTAACAAAFLWRGAIAWPSPWRETGAEWSPFPAAWWAAPVLLAVACVVLPPRRAAP